MSKIETKLTRTMINWAMFVITAAIFITLSKRTWTMMLKGMCVMKMSKMMVLVTIVFMLLLYNLIL